MAYPGCKECPYSPKTYEQFCNVRMRVKYNDYDALVELGLCPDAFTDASPLCGAYDKEVFEYLLYGG